MGAEYVVPKGVFINCKATGGSVEKGTDIVLMPGEVIQQQVEGGGNEYGVWKGGLNILVFVTHADLARMNSDAEKQ